MVAKYLNIASIGTPRGAPRIPESDPKSSGQDNELAEPGIGVR
jgi:hypothetical protein